MNPKHVCKQSAPHIVGARPTRRSRTKIVPSIQAENTRYVVIAGVSCRYPILPRVCYMNNTEKVEIELLGHDLQIYQSKRVICPVCGGGNSRERSLSVKQLPYGLLYHCFRASCGASGTIVHAGLQPDYDPDGQPMCQRQAQPYRGELHPLKGRDFVYFQDRFGLLPSRGVGWFGIMRTSLSDDIAQYVMTLQEYRGYTRGYAVRRGGWKGSPPTPGRVENTIPKTRTFMDRPDYIAQHVAWPEWGYRAAGNWEARVVLVEDYISALRVAQDTQAVGVALMGTHMNAERAREIYLLRPSEVVIALDADATEAALKMAREWGLSWNKTRVAILEKDIKDTSAGDTREALQL